MRPPYNRLDTPPQPGATTVRKSGIPDQADVLDHAVADLANQVETLLTELAPFLRPGSPATNAASEGPVPFCGSPVEQRLSGAISRIEYLSSELLDLRNRLAV